MYKTHVKNHSFSLSKIRAKKIHKNENKIKLRDATSTMRFYGRLFSYRLLLSLPYFIKVDIMQFKEAFEYVEGCI